MSNLRVIKLGGSLLALDDWPRRLADWLVEEPVAANVLLVGGGALADAIRDCDRRFALGEEKSHWLCIRALSMHAEIAATLLGRFAEKVQLVRDFESLCQLPRGDLAVFDPEPFLRDHESRLPGTPLPHTWTATSDSVAARLAECLDASELVLLKSAPPPENPTSAEAGYVDSHFAVAAKRVRRVRFVDLRSEAGAANSSAVTNFAE
jgi:aspartokinase-like uncharacterized kinase